MRVPDLCYLVYDYCDSGSLHKLSMTCKFQQRQLLSESPQEGRSLIKGYLVRILKFKYEMAARQLDVISLKVSHGQLIDVDQFR